MTSRRITITADDGGEFGAYLSLPPSGRGPGLVVIQEIFGVNGHIRAVADDFAQQGFVALAPDLFWRAEPGVDLGYAPQDIERGRTLRAAIDRERMIADLRSSADALRGREEVTRKVGAVGYCMGGQLSFALAATGAVDAAVSYYGAGTVGLLERAPQVKIPVQFHYGGRDHSIPPHEVQAVRDAFSGRDDIEVYLYDEADHGFNCDQRGSFDADAAALARERTLEFLRARLA